MQNKLQELTDRLYNEGLSKGKSEGEALLTQAKNDANTIVETAKKEAAAIIAQAKKDAEDLQTKVNGDLKMAANQSIAATKQDIENLIISQASELKVKEALADTNFLKEVITSVAKGFKLSESEEISINLPSALEKELESFVKSELSTILNKGVSSSFSKKISGGFTIGPKGSGFFVSFTDETFQELIAEYLRPATKKILFQK